MCTCACTCMYTEVCKRELSSARQRSPPEVQPSGHGISFGHWLLPWQLWPLWCFVLVVVYFRLFVFLNFVLFCLDMSLHMESKVIGPGETPVAVVTLKGLCTCVFPVVPCELIAPCKTPLTSFP